MKWNRKKIVVTGGGGFLGSHVVSLLKQRGATDLMIPRSKDFDLRSKENCAKVVRDADVVFHLAGKIGGLGLNTEKPGELFYDNLIMSTMLMEEARKYNVAKFITLGTVCSYPKFTQLPFSEEDLWDGYPEETSAAYGLAKRMSLVQSQAYRKQYGFNSIVLVPTNLYGPLDTLDTLKSHVIPALIMKTHAAKTNNSSEIVLWGDGSPTRDFLFVDDAAEGIVLAAEKYDKSDPVNLGSGVETSIKDLVFMIMKLMNVNLKIVWDKSKPNGQPRRCVDITRAMEEFGFKPRTNLEEGLAKTIDWYEATLVSPNHVDVSASSL